MLEQFSLTGRSALVTGGARGLGAAIAEAMSKAGASVVIGDILDDLGRETARNLAASGAKVGYVHLDVTKEPDWEAAAASVVQQTGGFDILVNNAGIEVTALISEIEVEGLRKMLDVNIVGTLLGLKHAFRAMRPGGPAGKGGSVVNIASVAATIAFPSIAAYSGTKSAVDRITRVAAAEGGKLGYGIRVNCIYPGLTPTEMGVKLAQDVVALGLFPSIDAALGHVVGLTPLGRMVEATEIADAAVFLASDASKFITGAGLPVEGGMGS